MILKNNTKFILRASEESEEAPQIAINSVNFEKRTINFRADINELSAAFLIEALDVLEEQSNKPIYINFSSPGGDVIEGLAIVDKMNECKCEIHIRARGKVMSMGFIIFLSADYREASANTCFMMHSIFYPGSPEHRAVKSHEADVLEAKRLNNVLLDIMAKRTNKPKNWWYTKIQSLVDKYFTTEEAKELMIIKPYKPVVKKKRVSRK